MSRKERFVWLAGCLTASLIGGAAVNLFWRTPGAFADDDHEKLMKAERFEVVDSDGKTRAVLTTTDDGSPLLVFTDGKGKARVTLGTMGTESGLAITDKGGKLRLALSYQETGVAALVLKDKKETPRADVLMNADGSCSMDLYDADGNKVEPGDGDK